MKKIVTIHQPYFMPWLGFFDKMALADCFVILDDVQFEKNSYLNRNKIKTPNGSIWLTIPTKGHLNQKINEVLIDESKNWREDHLKTIYFNYKKAKNFAKIYPKLEKIYQIKETNLAKFNLLTIKFLTNELKIKKTKFYLTSQMNLHEKGSKLLLEITRKLKGEIYLSGPMGKDYLNEDLFRDSDIEVIYQVFKAPKYQQLWGKFVPNLSALDYLLCDGRPLFKG